MKKVLSVTFTIVLCTVQIDAQRAKFHSFRPREFKSIGQGYLFSLRHYPKFFGDTNTIFAPLFDRSYILGQPDGFRAMMADHGVYLDATLFEFLGTNFAGGAKRRRLRYNGNAEYWAVIDTGKIGWWPQGAFMLHAESSWTVNDSINDDVGSLLAVNSRSRVPVSDKSKTTLSEVVLAQYITNKFVFRMGKLDVTGPIDATEFANNGRFQFLYSGLVNNPIIYTFTSYTSLGFLPAIKPNKYHEVMLYIADADGSADKSGFDTAFNGNTDYCIQYTFSPVLGNGLQGNYRFIYAHKRKPVTAYHIDGRHLAGKDITEIEIPHKCDNRAFLCNFDQYIFKSPCNDTVEHRDDLPPLGLLLFGRAGWAPQDRNVIDRFFSLGLGSYGGLRNRYYDQWGIGCAITHISTNLRRDLLIQQKTKFNACEYALEFFYNMQIKPALHFTADAQIVRPPLSYRGTAFVINMRLQADF